MRKPLNWPPGFQFSPFSVYKGISSNLFLHLLSSPDAESENAVSLRIESQSVHPHLEIRKITDPLHPLLGQYGVFATQQIPGVTEIGEYVGEIFFGQDPSDIPFCYKGVHCWRAAFGLFFVHVSSTHIANELAFVNDFRGLKEEPNVRPKWILHRGNFYFGFETIQEIEPQEELLVDYGNTWATKRGIA